MTEPSPKPTASARGMWLALGFVLSLFLVPYFIGFGLPDEYEGAVRADLAAAPSDVWDRITDHAAHPISGPNAQRVVDGPPTDAGLAQWAEVMERASLEVTTRLAESPRRLERVAIDRPNGVESLWTYELRPTEQGTELVVRQHMTITDPSFSTPYFRVFVHYLDFARQAPRDAVVSYADALGLPEPTVEPID